MKQNAFRDSDEFKRGRTGEQIVAGLLQEDGWHIVPSYDYSGDDKNKAPKLQGRYTAFVLPDLDACRDGQREWVEVKTKKSATFTRKTNRDEHGIPQRHWDSYKRVQAITGTRVWLCIYEETTGDILLASLDRLEETGRFYGGGKMSYGGMVFFPRSAFRIWRTIGTSKNASEADV